MGLRTLVILWGGLAALRLAFLAFHFRDLDGLWNDYARSGLAFQQARALDYVTLGVFMVAAVWALWGLDRETPDSLGRVFVAWLGVLLLERLPVHRFPRTNVPGGLSEAKLGFAVAVLLSVLGALGATIIAALWWRR